MAQPPPTIDEQEQEVLSRIRDLFAHSERAGCTPDEARTFHERALAMMLEHKFIITDVVPPETVQISQTEPEKPYTWGKYEDDGIDDGSYGYDEWDTYEPTIDPVPYYTARREPVSVIGLFSLVASCIMSYWGLKLMWGACSIFYNLLTGMGRPA